METIVGSGKYTYKMHEDWAQVPAGVDMKPAAVAVGPQDRVYCFNRVAEHPVVVFDRDGNFLSPGAPGCSVSPMRFVSMHRALPGSPMSIISSS